MSSTTVKQNASTQSSNINPPSSSGTFVRIEAVRLLIHRPSSSNRDNKTIYRKLLAPEPQAYNLLFVKEHFIKNIKLIEGFQIQFEIDFRVVPCDNTPQQQQQNNGAPDINLLFHEVLLDGKGIVAETFVENMGKFVVSPKEESYRYTTTLSSKTRSANPHSIRLEIIDLDRTAWFIGEWQVKLQSPGLEATDWLKRGNPEVFDIDDNTPILDFDDFDELNSEDFGGSGNVKASDLRIPSSFPSRTSSPLSQSSITNASSNTNDQQNRSPTNSVAASFEDLELTDFADFDAEAADDSLTLPSRTTTFSNYESARLKIDSLNALNETRRASNVPSRTGTPKQSTALTATEDNLSTIDILHQVGTNLFSSRLGQIVSSSIKSDPNEMNLKTVYSTSTIHLLGTKYQLEGLQSNVLLMEEDAGLEEAGEITRVSRFNNFSSLLKRLDAPNSSKIMVIREVLLLKKSGPILSSQLKSWFESCSTQNSMLQVVESTPATLRIANSKKTMMFELKVYCLKPNESSPDDVPELFLADLQATSSQNPNSFHAIAEVNAIFVEMMARIVQLEQVEARKAPEIVLMETWNSHAEPEQLTQSESIPIVKYSAIPESGSFMTFVYFWSDHLQGWLLQTLTIENGNNLLLSIHPLLDARMAIQVNLSGCHVKVSQDEDGKVGNFTLITSRGQLFNFRAVQISDLKEIIGRIRFAMLSRANNNTGNTGRNRRQASLLQADRIYRGSVSNQQFSEQEVERIRDQNMSTMDSFLEDFRSRFWFTYRRNFPRIEPTLFTTDLGWGCMLRTGQCLMAEALTRFYFGRNWRLWQLESDFEERERMEIMRQFHTKIVSQFIDQPHGEYSVHRMAVEGAKIGTPIGQWFGPSVIGKVLKYADHCACNLFFTCVGRLLMDSRIHRFGCI